MTTPNATTATAPDALSEGARAHLAQREVFGRLSVEIDEQRREGWTLPDIEKHHLAAGVDRDLVRLALRSLRVDERAAKQARREDRKKGRGQPARSAPAIDPITAANAGTPYAMTDLGNAERLQAVHGGKMRWDAARGKWRIWDGFRWAADDALKVLSYAAKVARAIRLEAAAAPKSDDGKTDLGADLFAWSRRSESKERLAAMVEVAKSLPGIAVAAGAWDADPWLLNVHNGILDLRTGALREHAPGDMLTKLVPVEYRPGHRDERWERLLQDATGNDPELILFLQVAIGYTLTGLTVEEVLFLVYGPEASGKTTFLEALRGVMGDYARTISADLLTKRREANAGAATPELACLAGVRLAAASELEQGRELAEALVKNITGGEAITARHLYAETFDYIPAFKLWLALNHCPRVSADDGSIWRRILRIGFEHTVSPDRRDRTLKPYLRDPRGGAPAVLVWAVEGCLQWQRDGLRIPQAVTRSTAAYRTEADPLATFIEDALVFVPAAWTPWSDIWSAYCEHASEQGTAERYRVAPKRVQERLRAAGCESERLHAGRGWRGVEIATDWTGPRDGRDACDATSQTFLHGGVLGKVQEMPSQPSRPSREPDEHAEMLAYFDGATP